MEENWLDQLDEKSYRKAKELIKVFNELECPNAEKLARSEIQMNNADLAMQRLLVPLRKTANNYLNNIEEWINNIHISQSYSSSDPDLIQIIDKMLYLGITKQELARFTYSIALNSIQEVLNYLDDPNLADNNSKSEGLPSWRLYEIDSEGIPTGRIIWGLSESL